MAGLAAKLRKWAGMSTKEEEKAGGSRTNVEKRGKQINRQLCEQGLEEYCPPKNIPTPTPGNGSRAQKEMKQGMDRYGKKRQ